MSSPFLGTCHPDLKLFIYNQLMCLSLPLRFLSFLLALNCFCVILQGLYTRFPTEDSRQSAINVSSYLRDRLICNRSIQKSLDVDCPIMPEYSFPPQTHLNIYPASQLCEKKKGKKTLEGIVPDRQEPFNLYQT